MKELKTNLWDQIKDIYDIACITTNGDINRHGLAVMGRGIALEATYRYPSIAEMLANKIKKEGNRVHLFLPFPGNYILTFPVKHHWYEKADLELIKKSTEQLKIIAESCSQDDLEVNILKATFYLPRPGCGNGKRDWLTEVKPIIECLPDNVIIVNNE